MKLLRLSSGDAHRAPIAGRRAALHPSIPLLGVLSISAAVVAGACATGDAVPDKDGPVARAEESFSDTGLRRSTPVGLAIQIENGAGVPLKLRAGQKFYLDQLDLRAAFEGATDEGVSHLAVAGDFASLSWQGLTLADKGPPVNNGNGTFTRRFFYRGAAWMEQPSSFTIVQLDDEGHPVGGSVTVDAGADDARSASDAFFIRRFRASQYAHDCSTPEDCTTATRFTQEALVELRNTMLPDETFVLHPNTRALSVVWSLKPDAPYHVPVEQIAAPAYDYGFSIDVAAITPPGPGGHYAPGQSVTFQLTLRDGSGKRLHPAGSLPTYNEAVFGPNEAGIQYYQAFFDPSQTYWRRKHRERMLMTQIIGPAQSIQPIRSVVPLATFLDDDDIDHIATLDRDGVYADFMTIPPSGDLFGGAFDPTHAGWDAPVSDTWSYPIPEDAPAGTYLVTVKGRRVYLGQDVPYTRTIEIQVGSSARTEAQLTTGPCNTCHSGGGSLSKVLHANDNRAACAGCHAPLAFELEGPIYVRTHFIHSRSDRVGEAAVQRCANCHLDEQSIQRTSKSACMSCHKSYPESHVAQFGPITDAYVGGGAESFQQCGAACHTSHPGSGF